MSALPQGEQQIVINEPVKWSERVSVPEGKEKVSARIPGGSTDISVFRVDDEGMEEVDSTLEKDSLFKYAARILTGEGERRTYVVVEDVQGELEIAYYTEAPKAEEKVVSENKKEVVVSSPEGLHYENVLAYTDIEEKTGDNNSIRVYWKEEKRYLDFEAFDKDGDGLFDYIEWIVPHLSEQTFEIIFIVKAEHLDANREFISDIFEEVRWRDGIWSEEIYHGEYVRVKFEQFLAENNDITIYVRNTQGKQTRVEVYRKDSLIKLTEFPVIEEEGYYKVYLNGLEGLEDTFDLRILNEDDDGSAFLEFDYIVDPQETLLPESDSVVALSTSGCSVNSECVNDSSDSSYVYETGAPWVEDIYDIANVSSGSGSINNVTVYVRMQRGGSSGPAGKTIIYTDQAYYGAERSLETSWADYSDTYATNPGGGAWTWDAVNSMQAGVTLKGGSGTREGRCSEVWVVVDYSVPSADLNVTLNYPTDYLLLNSRDVTFNYTPGSANGTYINCSLFDNSTGSLAFDQVNSTAIVNNEVNQFNKTYSQDGSFLWNVFCVDAVNSTFAVTDFKFTIDTVSPNVSLVSPADYENITDSFDLEFVYNVSDATSDIDNCSLYIDGVLVQTDSSITRDTSQSFFYYLNDGTYLWSVLCADAAGHTAIAENRTVNVNITQPGFSARFYETGTEDFTGSETAVIWLNNSRDATQNTAAFTLAPGERLNMVNATSWFADNNGAVIPGGTTVSFSASWTVTDPQIEITWKLYITNSSGVTLLCQNGDDGAGGTPVNTGTISASNSTCISSDVRLEKSDRLLLVLNGYNTHGSLDQSVTHAWDGSTSSYVDVNLTTEGFLDVELTSPLVDPSISSGETFNASCDVNCSIGFCRDTYVYVQYNTSSTAWADISSSGNLILRTGETNPHYVGNVSTTTVQTNFTIEGNAESVNNIRCRAVSDYDAENGTTTTQVTVGAAAAAAPIVNKTSPGNETWFNTTVELFYNVSDINDNLANSTLILNGEKNLTNQSALLNGEINNFTLDLPDGTYTWTVNATDTTNLEGTDLNVTVFYVDTNAPSVNLSTPVDNETFQVSTIEFNFTVSDFMDSVLVCDLIIDSAVEDDDFSANNGTLINRTIVDIGMGDHLWNVTCWDEAGNSNTSQTWNFSIGDLPPTVDLITANNSFTNTGNITLVYNATDNNGFIESILILNGVINQTNQSEILNGEYNNFTLVDLAEGVYTWNVNVTDTAGLTAVNGTPRTFTVDKTVPNVTLNLPANDTTSNSSSVSFNFTVIDNLDTSLTCNLSIDGVSDDNIVAANGSLINRPISGLTDGEKYWNVTCWDDAGNSNISETWLVNITEYPTIQLDTQNDSYFNVSSFNLSYTPSDNTNLSNCSLYIDGEFNQSNQTEIINGQQNNFSVEGISSGVHTWYVVCLDLIGLQNQSETRTFTVDLNGLNVSLLWPNDGAELFIDTVEFSYNVTDDIDEFISCNITVNNDVVDSFDAQNANITNRSVFFSTGGFKLWNLTCWDDALNSITSETRNFTLAFAPVVNLTSPPVNYYTNVSNITLYYNVSDDNDNLANSTLILNGGVNQTNQSALLNGEINNFTLTNLADGVYTWAVNATDDTNLAGNSSERNFTIDTHAPTFNLSAPSQGDVLDWNNITFNFTVIDNLDTILTCDLNIDGAAEPGYESLNISNGSFTTLYVVKDDGNYTWSVSCVDEASNYNISEEINFTVDAPPKVTLLDPTQEEMFNISSITFVYLPEDAIGIYNCSLYIDDVFNDTDDTVTANENNSFPVSGLGEGLHNWTVECVDVFPDLNVGVSNTSNFTVDLTPPSITLNAPGNYSNVLREVTFNFSAEDNFDANISCDLYIDGVLNISGIIVVNGSSENRTVGGNSLGLHTWNVSCEDDVSNVNWSATWEYNVTLPDLMVNESAIDFNNTSPRENETVLINVTVYNLVNVTITNVTVQFYDGDPDSSGEQIGSDQTISSISGLGQETASVAWGANLGTSQIFVVVDPPLATNGSIEEWTETNNEANRSITVGGWHYVVGDINSLSKYELAEPNSSVMVWTAANFDEGNLYVVDSESIVSWTDLQAIGQDTSDANTANDFTDMDALLNMTNFIDSVSDTYTNSSGDIINVTAYTVFNGVIDEVPIANSTNNTNFFTGILWDASDDDADGEYSIDDAEDLVFIAAINKNKQGAYGIYDYEIRIPAQLREYKDTETRSVVFYSELR
ncbi:MAG: hypothetical protein ABIH92_02675 [Nanoarchaeota archaeon]